MSAYEVAEIVISKGLGNRTEPLAFANMRGGRKDRPSRVHHKQASKFVNDLFETTWEMEMAKASQECKLKSRIELLRETRQGECTCEVESE